MSQGKWIPGLLMCRVLALHLSMGTTERHPTALDFVVQYSGLDFSWKDLVRPIMKMYADSTDGSYVQEKDCAISWVTQLQTRTLADGRYVSGPFCLLCQRGLRMAARSHVLSVSERYGSDMSRQCDLHGVRLLSPRLHQ